jgi:hypothetical protein
MMRTRRGRRGEPVPGVFVPVTSGGWQAMEVELKRDAKGVIDRIVHLRDSL